MKKSAQLDFLNSDDEDNSIGNAVNNDEDVDISSALLPSSSKKNKEEDDDDQFIMDVMQTANKSKGKEVAKELNKGKGKGPKAKAQVGGGSFQSMGEILADLLATSNQMCRFEPISFTFFIPSRFQSAYTYPAFGYSTNPLDTTKGSRWYGSYRFG